MMTHVSSDNLYSGTVVAIVSSPFIGAAMAAVSENTDTVWLQLGIAGPLVAILLYLLKTTTDERREANRQFIEALKGAVESNTKTMQGVTAALDDQVMLMREARIANAAEHKEILEMVRLLKRLE